MAQAQDSLIELRHTRKVHRKLMMNHYMQIAGQGQRANTCSRSVLNSVKGRIAKFVERYRVTYRALLQLDPTGNWQEVYLELKDADNRGPGKEADEGGVGDGSYSCSWIWLPNPRVPDSIDGDLGEEGASEEDVNEALRVEWTTSFARLERWNEEVDLLEEEMHRVVMFMEWKSQDWLAKADASWADLTPDVQSGLSMYAKKQAAIHCDLAVSFAKLWHPTLTSYGLQHSWNTEYLVKNGVSLDESETTALSTRGIFKFRFGDESHKGISTAGAVPSFVGGLPTIAQHLRWILIVARIAAWRTVTWRMVIRSLKMIGMVIWTWFFLLALNAVFHLLQSHNVRILRKPYICFE